MDDDMTADGSPEGTLTEQAAREYHERMSDTYGLLRDAGEGGYALDTRTLAVQRAQVHATLAQAAALRLVAEELQIARAQRTLPALRGRHTLA